MEAAVALLAGTVWASEKGDVGGTCRIAVALLFVAAAALKWKDPASARSGLAAIGIGQVIARVGVVVAAAAEVGGAAILIVVRGASGVWPAFAVLAVFSAYLVVLSRRSKSASCGCFGDYSSGSPYPSLVRNGLLLGLLGVTVLVSPSRPALVDVPAALELAALLVVAPEGFALLRALLQLRHEVDG